MRLVTVATSTFPAQAHLMKALLEDEGILCRLANEHYLNAYGGVEGVLVQVPEDAADAARAVLAEAERTEEDASLLVAVATFDDPLDAHAAAAALHDADVPHSIAGEGALGTGGAVALLVPEDAADAARDVLARR
ncbi:MAG: DUF2007 domain-containing protein [Rhodothermales bacterium]|nr:DUF2007 domain-containing protein [Rhodothermales bacterium]